MAATLTPFKLEAIKNYNVIKELKLIKKQNLKV
jgi:hypothetical protein